jgi:hypothetical protein
MTFQGACGKEVFKHKRQKFAFFKKIFIVELTM